MTAGYEEALERLAREDPCFARIEA